MTYESSLNFIIIQFLGNMFNHQSYGDCDNQTIEIKSIFESTIEYECEMSTVYSSVINIQDLIHKYRNVNTQWTMDEHKLLTFLYNNDIYNQHDINSWGYKLKMNALKTKWSECNESIYKKIGKQLDNFIRCIQNDKSLTNTKFCNGNVVNGVEITRNGTLLQQYIRLFFMKYGSKNGKYLNNNTLILTYNPIQSCITTTKIIKDITHPIHIYRSAYSQNLDYFYNEFQLKCLYNKWMKQPQMYPQTVDILFKQKDLTMPKANAIDTISLLIRYSKKYEIVLVPSSIEINNMFLNEKCNQIAPDIDALSGHRVSFLYKGILYYYLKKNVEETKSDDGFFLDEIKSLIKNIKENIIDNSIDYMDVKYITNNKNENRLRSIVKRYYKDTMLNWLKIGCGSCFIHEPSGHQIEIGPPISGDWTNDFPNLVKKAMFEYWIDCRIPFNLNQQQQQNICNLCGNYMIEATLIKQCKLHTFCKKCIVQWQSMINSFNWGIYTFKHDFEANVVDLGKTNLIKNHDDINILKNIILPKYCP
eukprot:383788_1